MSLFKQANKILGMNARNLLFLGKYNTHANKKFADDKIFTKNFLESRGVGVAKLYHVVKKHTELTDEFFDALPKSFVVKPNLGFAGAGILVITEHKKNTFITVSGKKLTKEFLFHHFVEILDGKYSISGTSDKVIIEEILVAHPAFRELTEVGLPDVRMIVFNQVPIMAMSRIPTIESDGKANMELGAVGMGIDIGTGRTTGGALFSKFIKKMPNGTSTKNFQIPFWDEILLTCARIQNYTKIGFLGVDIVITKTGVKVLELNARAGLKIQIANRTPLKSRLEKVQDLKVQTPEDGVEIAKTLFAEKNVVESDFIKKPVIGITENVVLNSDPPQNLLARIDLSGEENIISSRFKKDVRKLLDITLEDNRLKLPFSEGRVIGADLVLAGKFLTDFYIDPSKKVDQKVAGVLTSNLEEKVIRNVDEKVCDIDEQIKLLAYINPRNISEQKKLFNTYHDFSPRFSYRECNLDFDYLRSELKKIPQANHFLFPLYEKKIIELDDKLSLLESIDSSEFTYFSKKIFGEVTPHYYRLALDFIRENYDKMQKDSSEILDYKQAMEILENFLKKHKLPHWKIKIMEDTVVDVQVTKKNTIILKKSATFKANRLKALLVHEIGTHVFRYENGKLQNFRLLERGTAGYLRTEEGLAVWNQNQLGLDLGEKTLTPAFLVVAVYLAEKMGFHDLFQYLKNTFEIDDALVWKLCVKAKRGFSDTGQKGAFTKDAIYFLGLRDIERFIKKGGVIADLYTGKIAIDDLKFIKQIEGLRKPKLVI